jgi:penicillin-binding protein 1A
VLYQWREEDAPKVQVVANPPLTHMNRMMRQVLASGTATAAAIPGYDLAGKTGTTSDYKDAWFVGYTGGFVTAVWVGKDDATPMRRVTGAGAPAAIWKSFMQASLPRLRTGTIPTGPAPAGGWGALDPIGDLLNQAGQLLGGGEQAPPSDDPVGELLEGRGEDANAPDRDARRADPLFY